MSPFFSQRNMSLRIAYERLGREGKELNNSRRHDNSHWLWRSKSRTFPIVWIAPLAFIWTNNLSSWLLTGLTVASLCLSHKYIHRIWCAWSPTSFDFKLVVISLGINHRQKEPASPVLDRFCQSIPDRVSWIWCMTGAQCMLRSLCTSSYWRSRSYTCKRAWLPNNHSCSPRVGGRQLEEE